MSDLPPPQIMGPDGRPLPGQQPPTQQMTPEQFCSGVLGAYVQQMMSSGVDPFEALVQMGTQIPFTMIQLIRNETGLTTPAKEPLEFLLRNISNVLRKNGFRFYFGIDYAGEDPATTEQKGNDTENGNESDTKSSNTNEPDPSREIQGSCNQENKNSSKEPR